MSNQGKTLQVGAGSRRRGQAKAEDTARRSRKRASKRAAMREVSLEAPRDLSEREFSAFRLGALSFLIAASDQGAMSEPPAIYMQAFRTEHAYRLDQLEVG